MLYKPSACEAISVDSSIVFTNAHQTALDGQRALIVALTSPSTFENAVQGDQRVYLLRYRRTINGTALSLQREFGCMPGCEQGSPQGLKENASFRKLHKRIINGMPR